MSNYNNPNSKTALVQSQVDEVKGIIVENINLAVRNNDNLNTLQDKTSTLVHDASTFQKTATKVKRAAWWKNMKLNLILLAIVLVIIGIIVAIVYATK